MDLRSAEFAHDLKMPIQLIYSCVQLLEMELQHNARAERYLKMLTQSADQLQSMVHSALDGGASSEDETLRLSRRDLVDEVRNICNQTALFAGEKRIGVAFKTNAAAFYMQMDAEKLERILDNLLSNALRFTPEQGKISVELQIRGDSAEISVSDSGCGFSDEAPIFERGYTTGGHGYGLAIVRKYANLLGGSVWAQSFEGRGSCFTLRLPVRK